jgi:integrase
MMRLPNGYGSVYKLSGNRRRPWIARKTIECRIETVDGKKIPKQHYVTVGYYATQSEALQSLAAFNSNPYDLDAAKITFKELYEKWSAKKYLGIKDSRGYVAAYKLSWPLCDMKFADIRTDHMQAVIDGCGRAYPTQKNMKILYSLMYKYALERDVAAKDYSQFVTVGKKVTSKKHKPFTQKEIDKLFECVGKYDDVESVLILIYSGVRPGELILIETENVNLEERYMVGGIKTPAGENRIIPINKKIYEFVSDMVQKGNKYLLCDKNGNPFSYDKYLDHFKILMEQLVMDHLPHDGRYTFATLMGNAGADTVSLQKIIGHANYNTTANTYTHKDIDELKKAIDLI